MPSSKIYAEPAAAPASQRQFPMMVLPIETAISMERMPKHEDIQGDLVEWTPGMGSVVFFSHTWLGFKEPDPQGVKWQLARKILRKALAGTLQVSPHWSIELIFGKLKVTAHEIKKQLTGGYVWCDWASVPQADAEAQGRAIASLASYVADSAMFICLAGPWEHADNGSIRDMRAWANRGWCRLENLANAVATGKRQLIVAESSSSIVSYGPTGLVGHGWMIDQVASKGAQFTIDSDREVLGPVIADMIADRKAAALRLGGEDELAWFRFLQCRTAYLLEGTGYTVPQEETLQEWLEAMRFTSPTEDESTTGLTPLLFAVLANRTDVVSQLIDLGANLDPTPRKDYPQFMLSKQKSKSKGWILGGAAAYFVDSPEMLELLFARGVDPRGTVPCTILDNACIYGRPANVDYLLRHDPSLVALSSSMLEMQIFYPLSYILFMGQLSTFEQLLETQPAVVKEYLDRGRAGPHVGLSTAAVCVLCSGNVELLKLVLASGVDVNWVGMECCDPTMISRKVIPFMDFVLRFTKQPSAFMQYFVYAGPRASSPLHIASFTGNLGAVDLLLEHKADVHSTKHALRMTPLHLAAMGGHELVVDALLRAGARPTAKAKGGTPKAWAKRRGHVELAGRL